MPGKWVKGMESPNPKGRTKGSFSPSTFVKRELYEKNKDRIKEVVDVSFKEALAGKPWAIKLIYEYFVGKQTDLDDENVEALVADKLKEVSVEQLESMKREVFEVVKKQLTEERPVDG